MYYERVEVAEENKGVSETVPNVRFLLFVFFTDDSSHMAF